MDLTQVEAFIAVAEDLHFGRAAERLNLSQPRVSRLVAALEGDIGGALFERTSRQVRLTPLGVQLRDGLRPAHAQLKSVFDEARAAARTRIGSLRIGVTEVTGGAVVTSLIRRFERICPRVAVTVHGVDPVDPYGPLRRRQIDVLVNWLFVDEPDMVCGPVIDYRDRVLAVSVDHPFASRPSVSIEDLAEYEVIDVQPPFPRALLDAFVPPRTPAGRTIRRTMTIRSISEAISLVACNRIVHPTVTGVAPMNRPDIVLVRIEDMDPLPLGLIWRSAHRNPHIAALAEVAAKCAPALMWDPVGAAPAVGRG